MTSLVGDGVVELVVQADDFGMCAPVTDGILRCFRAGVVTQASVMAPAPDARRALGAARRERLPLGVHLTLMCEWDGLRWYPLTSGASLRVSDGAFPPDLPSLRCTATLAEAEAELVAQIDAVLGAGVDVHHIESHVRVFDEPLLERLVERYDVPSRDLAPRAGSPGLDSIWHLSIQPTASKADALLEHVRGLPPGTHMIVAHPADDAELLTTLCSPSSRRWKWAREIRLGDSAALLDPRFRALCESREVRLTTWSPRAHRSVARASGISPGTRTDHTAVRTDLETSPHV